MKKIATFLMLFVVIGMSVSCEKKATPEEEVRNYGKYFVEKINDNQLDSLKFTYQDIVKADSIMPIKSDTIIVSETAPGQYDMTLINGTSLKIKRSDDGNISVTESKGLFAFPADKVDIAKKTGMWDDKLSDAQLNERMKDDEFFNYLNKRSQALTSNILTLDRKLHITKEAEFSLDEWKGYYNITNNTDYPIKGKDYTVQTKWEWMAQGAYEHGKENEPGKDIAPHSTIKYPISGSGRSSKEITGIKIKIPEDELMKMFASYTGKEYQEYLDSKK